MLTSAVGLSFPSLLHRSSASHLEADQAGVATFVTFVVSIGWIAMFRSPKSAGERPSLGRRAGKVASITAGICLAGTGAYAATNWLVGLNGGSAGAAQSATISNLTVTATTMPTGNLLYPGATGDAVLTIANPNAFPVTITGFTTPSSATYATGYSNATLATPVAGCTSQAGAAPSLVSWTFAGASTVAHTLTSAVTVPANATTFQLTLTGDATMGLGAPLLCANTYFSMPSLTAVAASGGASALTTSPATSSWTS
jgi:hypothetical protein